MKKSMGRIIILVTCLVLPGLLPAGNIPEGTFYTAVEQDGTVCGYSREDITLTEIDGKKLIEVVGHVELKMSLLGAAVDATIKTTTHVDKTTGQFVYSEYDIQQGKVRIGGECVIENDTAIITSRPDGKVKRLPLGPDVLRENATFMPHLLRDFTGDVEEKKYRVLDLMDGNIHDVVYSRIGREQLELAGKNYDCIHFRRLDNTTGVKIEQYINAENGIIVKNVLPTRTMYLADESVVDKVEMVSIDDRIISKTDVAISDVAAIDYMKVEAELEPGGLWVTEAGLNIPGQKFEGTIEENLIRGVFEISYDRYDGTDAPKFPPDFSDIDSLGPYLEAEDMVQSDDPVLMEKARELTAGSKDSWEAFCRLSKWVAEEIGYDIPGGGDARNTYDMRLGECGAHSRLLAAFARAVDIPCRVVWGCMYIPDFGGGFGQHGWNEVYMGEAGWIPVDATAKEIDFVDSGHLRIGALSSKSSYLNPKSMKILDYRAGDVTMATAGVTETPEKYLKYVGEYEGEAGTFTILVQNNNLAVDIPNKMIFELKEPDRDGVWYFKLTDAAGISFKKGDAGNVTGMTLVSKSKLPRSTGQEEDVAEEDVPEDIRPYLGKYTVPMQGFELTVIYRDGNLAVDDPNKGIIGLKGPDDQGRWIDEFDKNQIAFETGAEGKASAMVFYSNLDFKRKD